MANAKNFAKVTLQTGITAGATSLALVSGQGTRLPAAPYNAVIWNATDHADPSDDPDVEIVRVLSGADTLTITRAQELTTAKDHNTAGKTYKLQAGLTVETLNGLVQKSGDGMLGTLTLNAPPTAVLHAANKGYVDAIATGQVAGVYLMSSFGASGSEVYVFGHMTAGTNQVNFTSTATFAVGQGALVAGAGPGGANLVSQVTAIIDGSTMTLAANASTTVSGVMVLHDDTAAFQTALNLLTTVKRLTLIFDAGLYRINGPINPATNSILTIPFEGFYGGPPRTLRLIGEDCPISGVMTGNHWVGPLIQSDTIGTNANSSILNCGPYIGGSDFNAVVNGMNYMTIEVRGLTWRTYDNPNLSALDLAMAWNVVMENVLIDTGNPPEGAGNAEPTHGTFGLRLPRASTIVQTTNVSVACYGYGVIFADLWNTRNTYIIRCKVGCYTRGYDYPIVGDILIVQCPTGIEVEGNALGDPGLDLHVRWETSSPGWYAPITNRFIYDPTNVLFGQIKYIWVNASGVRGEPITVTGCTGLTKTNLMP